ncbi:di/tricarboxylate transporter [Parabacteroides sp. PF5-5]|uniref:SLC13 family permease n=1 Tax=unclassified Parabacteroides TaxID=2649774 RepID=UPI002477151D|nr:MULTISPECIES: SLC13 family permease [unclassified Parabacteroides]MDH6304347.1 di/tricarboxylate transporter [Parabacteroides sp. PH5-39]MDH6315500.1 di/tricarboxylate transporter [Parabacteroides sp. PF5-13]MDH6319006.1 di/tricarboxylate transporter [Parabacteroides sp. PH5-13]MDH6322735.1 di/tricarboxylate transporter [Parabacteroides sp. PH5-8]MDH6326693.1 di/tricarboxylate transporter [Parabacteroides sp. PH5-41]
MNLKIIFVLVVLAGMVVALIKDRMRPGMILFSVSVLFLCVGILNPREVLEGFSNKGMITVAMLFLVSEGIRQSGTLAQLFKKFLPKENTTITKSQLRLLPTISGISAFLNNTPVVVIFAPIIKRWAESVKLPSTKFLLPLTYATSLGGVCTLIGTSTNLVVHGMMLEAGYDGFSMFELSKIGVPIAIVGIIYMLICSGKLLPESRNVSEEFQEENRDLHKVEAVLGPRFPGINKTLGEFDFHRHYGATVKEVKTGGQYVKGNLDDIVLKEGDTLVLLADDSFIPTWGESRVFLMLANGKDEPEPISKKKKWFALVLFLLMITGATLGELPIVQEAFPDMKLDMFFFVCITTVIMAWMNLFPAKKYTKYISWDILITIACAFAISKAIGNSGLADVAARYIISLSETTGPYVLLAMTFLITNIFTQLITNNAAAALGFPVALSVATQLGVNPTPFFVVICVAASTSFISPVSYQTNMIVQGIGGYTFMDFVKFGLPLNIIVFLLAVFLTPLIWPF